MGLKLQRGAGMISRVEKTFAKRSPSRGFTLFELIFVSALALMVFVAILLSITSFGYSQTRSELLFAADMVLTNHAESATHLPYDDLDTLTGQEEVEQNGYKFQLTTEVNEVNGIAPSGAKRILFHIVWEDKVGKGARQREVLRSKPW